MVNNVWYACDNGVLDGLSGTGLQDGLFELLLTFRLIFLLLLICETSK